MQLFCGIPVKIGKMFINSYILSSILSKFHRERQSFPWPLVLNICLPNSDFYSWARKPLRSFGNNTSDLELLQSHHVSVPTHKQALGQIKESNSLRQELLIEERQGLLVFIWCCNHFISWTNFRFQRITNNLMVFLKMCTGFPKILVGCFWNLTVYELKIIGT